MEAANGQANKDSSYVPLDNMTPEMRAEMERCARGSTPRPESSAVRAQVPPASGISPTRGTTSSAMASSTTPSRNCAASTSRVRWCANSAATSVRSRASRRGVREAQIDDLMELRKVGQVQRAGRKRRSPTPKPSSGATETTTHSGSACTNTTASRSWWNWAARSA